MRPNPFQIALRASLPLALGLAGCSGGGGPPPAGKTTEETLHALGVDTTETPRMDDRGQPLPEDNSPLGKTFELEKLSELLLVGVLPKGSSAPLSAHDLAVDPLADPAPPVQLHAWAPTEVPFASEQQPTWMPPLSLRAAARADLDGDGREETALVWFADDALHLTVLEDVDADWARTDAVLLDLDLDVKDVSVAGGDLDGDGDAELAIAYTLAQEARVVVADASDGAIALVPGAVREFDNAFEDSLLTVELEIGDLDHDGPQELALALNEYTAPVAGQDYRSLGASWAVLDDLGTDLAVLTQRELEAKDATDVTRTALVLDVALGDLDADGLDELALAGLWRTDKFCAGSYVLAALDDAAHGISNLASTVLFEELGNEPGGDSGCEVSMLFAHVGVADMENDAAAEIVVNEMIFADLASEEPFTIRAQIPDWFTLGWVQDPSQSAMAFGDFTGDGHADVATWAAGRKQVAVWGIDGHTGSDEVELLRTLAVEKGSLSTGANPILLPVNADDDTTVLEFVERKYLMTEPMVIAVLSAAPGKEGVGQNTDACTTEYGEAESLTTTSDWDVSVSAGFIIGKQFKILGKGAEVKAKIQGHYEHVWTSSYNLTTSVAYETGPLEDTVVCLVTPYDHYTYRVIADPDPDLVGGLIELSVPREPISLQVERAYYNASIGPDELQIDSAILGHTPGAPDTYMGAAAKDDLLAVHGGMETGPVGVGQGAGSTTLGIAVTEEKGHENYLGFSVEVEVEVTLPTKKLGGSIGFGGGHTWSRSVGNETTYAGTVGSIDGEHFVDERFDFGMFVYTRDESAKGQAFDVIQYWVE